MHEEEGGRGCPHPYSSRAGAWSGSGGAPGCPNTCPHASRTPGEAGEEMDGTHDCRRGRTREARAHMGRKESEGKHAVKGSGHGCNASGRTVLVC